MNRRGCFPENLIYKQPLGPSVPTPGLGKRDDAEKTLRDQKKETHPGGRWYYYHSHFTGENLSTKEVGELPLYTQFLGAPGS